MVLSWLLWHFNTSAVNGRSSQKAEWEVGGFRNEFATSPMLLLSFDGNSVIFLSGDFFYLVLREQSCFWDFEGHRYGATVWRWDSGSGDVLDLLREVVCLSAPCSVRAHCGCQVNVRLSLFPAFEVSFPTHDKWFPRSSCRKGKNSSPANHSPGGVNPVECPIS